MFFTSLRDDEKVSLRSIFHLSLGKNIGATFSRSARNGALEIHIHRLRFGSGREVQVQRLKSMIKSID